MMEVREVPIESLNAADYNPRTISDEEIESLKRSIHTFGFVENIVANKDGTVVGGHQRIRAAKELGLKTVPVHFVDLPKDREKALNIALNKIQGRFDMDKLPELIASLPKAAQDLTGFSDIEISVMLEKVATEMLGEDLPPKSFGVVVECRDAEDEQSTYQQLIGLGLTCRPL